jgi:hypothetical protein
MIDSTLAIFLEEGKKILQEGYNCVLCQDSVEEIVDHLFFDCPAAVSRWFALGITWADSVDIYQRLIIAGEASPTLSSWKSS